MNKKSTPYDRYPESPVWVDYDWSYKPSYAEWEKHRDRYETPPRAEVRIRLEITNPGCKTEVYNTRIVVNEAISLDDGLGDELLRQIWLRSEEEIDRVMRDPSRHAQ